MRARRAERGGWARAEAPAAPRDADAAARLRPENLEEDTMRRLPAIVAALLVSGCATMTTTDRLNLAPLDTVRHVDLQRYLGTWYEIASFPQSFQKNCTATTAKYSLRADGDIDVENRCRRYALDNPEDVAKGRARVVDRATNAKLEVTFFRPFWGDYWIIQLGDDYGYAVVGHPSRDYLWILARQRTMSPDLYQAILQRLGTQGYDTSRLLRTLQPPEPAPGAGTP
jgi:apolipoprotein D and lipocalin family protein